MTDTDSSLLTDLYQPTMAQGYWKSGIHDRQAVFHLLFRKNPFHSGFSIAAGLQTAVEYLESYRFGAKELDYLASLRGGDGLALFDPAFLRYLAALRLTVDVDAIPEGSVVFAHEPLLRVQGSLLQCQLLETALLTILNFQTLIATKAARICLAAKGASVLEFGLRRAQGFDGALSAARAAYLGGCHGTSNLLAGQRFGIPVRGTHAHSWVLAFDDELASFEAYASAMPNNVLLLVDTWNTLAGVQHAIEVGTRLREHGHDLAGIRLDSGDLAYLSIEARRMLDAAGFTEAKIVASNDLDENVIASLLEQGAKIDIFGVGTRLVTAWDDPALSGVYKLTALRDRGGRWTPRLKLSEDGAKISTPGILQVRRFIVDGEYRGDAIYDLLDGDRRGDLVMIDPADATRSKRFPADCQATDLLVPVLRNGVPVIDLPPLAESRARVQGELAHLHDGILRRMNPHIYPVGLEAGLYERKQQLIRAARNPQRVTSREHHEILV